MKKLLLLFNLILLFGCSKNQKTITGNDVPKIQSGVVYYDIDLSETKDVNPEDFGTKAEVTFNSEKLLLRKLVKDGNATVVHIL